MKTAIVFLVLASIVGLLYCSDDSLAVTQEPEDKELWAMLEARRDALQGGVTIIKAAHVEGRPGTTIDKVAAAKLLLLEAELKLTKSQQERIAIYEKMLQAQTVIEHAMTERWESGTITKDAVFFATADRIRAEIDLHKARKAH